MLFDMLVGDFRGEFKWVGKEYFYFWLEMNVVVGYDLYFMIL